MNRLSTYLLSTAVLAVTLLLSSCGQSGPLYIPGDPSQMAVPPSEPADAEEEKEESEPSPQG